jgi:uncharacterized protein YegJ (DUF2314 family)
MRLVHAILLATAVTGLTTGPLRAQSVLEKANRDDGARAAKGDPDMEAAFCKTQARLPEFLPLKHAPRPSIDHFAVKVAVHDGDESELFWISPFDEKDGL